MFSRFLKSGIKKIKNALAKTRSLFTSKLSGIFKKGLSDENIELLEQTLYEADLGSSLVDHFITSLSSFAKKNQNATSDDFINEMKTIAKGILDSCSPDYSITTTPHTILVVGVNGSGKTTSCAKLAKSFIDEGKKPLFAAGDTFRAAAIEQLELWAKKINLPIIKSSKGSDPSSVIFDALSAAKARGHDIVIADTAGRLQSKTDLMQELKKICNVCEKVIPGSPHKTFLVLDATTGQNAIDQAKIFHEFTPLSGIILTKLDGSAKGGIALSIYHQMKLPIYYVGLGEKEEDFVKFNPDEYVEALFSN